MKGWKLPTWLRNLLALTLLAAAAAYFASQFREQGVKALERFREADPRYLVGATFFIFVSYALDANGSRFAYNLSRPRSRMDYRTAFGLFSLSNLVRYLPGSYWSYLFQLERTLRLGYEGWGLIYSNVLNAVWGNGIASVLAGLGLCLIPEQRVAGITLAGSAFAALLTVLFLPRLAARILTRLARLRGGAGLPSPAEQTRGLLYWLASWLVAGAGAALIAGALGGKIDLTEFALITGAMAAGGVASAAAAFVPAGLGVREGAMFWMLKPLLGPELALFIPLGSRVIFLICELGMAMAALTFYRARPLEDVPAK